MRIVQIIDSLEAGGAERMAVNYANSLSDKIEFSGIVATRKEGILKSEINKNVDYLFLNKKSKIDFKAIFKLYKYCKNNSVEYLQSHTSSYFIAFLIKLICPKIKIIWHDHYGLSDFLHKRKSLNLKLASFFFTSVIVVNYQLKKWAEKELYCNKIIYLPNFTKLVENEIKQTILNGVEGKKILCLANLRIQKNHFLLLNVAKKVKEFYPTWTFHLVGKDFNDDYSTILKNKIINENLMDTVFIYDSRKDIHNIINQSEICILTSQSEGLPVSLLEYGLNKKPVVVTNVGEIPFIIKDSENGFMVNFTDELEFYDKLEQLIKSESIRNEMGIKLYDTVQKNNSETSSIETYLNWLVVK